MTVNINYSNKSLNETSSNIVLFVNEKFNIDNIKKYVTDNELYYIKDLLKTSDLKKKLLVFIFLVIYRLYLFEQIFFYIFFNVINIK